MEKKCSGSLTRGLYPGQLRPDETVDREQRAHLAFPRSEIVDRGTHPESLQCIATPPSEVVCKRIADNDLRRLELRITRCVFAGWRKSVQGTC